MSRKIVKKAPNKFLLSFFANISLFLKKKNRNRVRQKLLDKLFIIFSSWDSKSIISSDYRWFALPRQFGSSLVISNYTFSTRWKAHPFFSLISSDLSFYFWVENTKIFKFDNVKKYQKLEKKTQIFFLDFKFGLFLTKITSFFSFFQKSDAQNCSFSTDESFSQIFIDIHCLNNNYWCVDSKINDTCSFIFLPALNFHFAKM